MMASADRTKIRYLTLIGGVFLFVVAAYLFLPFWQEFYPSPRLFTANSDGSLYIPASSPGGYCSGNSCVQCDPDHASCGSSCRNDSDCGSPPGCQESWGGCGSCADSRYQWHVKTNCSGECVKTDYCTYLKCDGGICGEEGAGNGRPDECSSNAQCTSPSPTADIKANGSDGPITIPTNTSATITWSSTNASSCSISPTPPSTGGATSGSGSTANLTATTTYTLNCTGAGGSASDSVRVNVSDNAPYPPTADIKANGSDGPITIPTNTSATITWSSTNASSCSISPTPPSTGGATSGSGSTALINSDRTYLLSCSNIAGIAGDSVVIRVRNPQCSDGIDNDGDGLIDYPADLDCSSTSDDSEGPPKFKEIYPQE